MIQALYVIVYKEHDIQLFATSSIFSIHTLRSKDLGSQEDRVLVAIVFRLSQYEI